MSFMRTESSRKRSGFVENVSKAEFTELSNIHLLEPFTFIADKMSKQVEPSVGGAGDEHAVTAPSRGGHHKQRQLLRSSLIRWSFDLSKNRNAADHTELWDGVTTEWSGTIL